MVLRQVAPPRPAERTTGLDGLRALAAGCVLVGHSLRSSFVEDRAFLWRLLDRTVTLSVVTFFVMSAFFLYRPIAEAHLAGRAEPSTSRYLARRAVRLLPAYWVALATALWVFETNRPDDAGLTLQYLTLTHSYRFGYALRGLFVAWTLVVEAGFYLLLPVVAILLCRLTPPRFDRRARARTQLAALAALLLAGTAFRWVILADAATFWKINWPMAWLDDFAAGMLLALGLAWVRTGGRLPSLVRDLAETRWLCWGLVGLLLAILPGLDVDVAPDRTNIMVAFALYTLAGALLVLPFALAPTPASRVMRTLGSPAGAYLGSISYGLYLWHGVLLPPIDRAVAEGTMSSAFLPRFLLLLGGSGLLAAASWHLLERPTMRALRRWERRTAHPESGRAAKASG